MTKLRWEKAGQRERDPGSVIEVPDTSRPWKFVSSEEQARRQRERRKEDKERGEAIRRAELDALFADTK